MDTKMRGIKAEQVGVDELFGFVNCKQYHCPQDDLERGDQYTPPAFSIGAKHSAE